MSESKKFSKALFVVILSLCIFVAALLTYREGARRHFAKQHADGAVQQTDVSQTPASQSAEPTEEPTKDKRLVKYPGGDVGYASDIEGVGSSSVVSAEQPSSPTPDKVGVLSNADDFEAAILWDNQKDSTNDEEVRSVPSQDYVEPATSTSDPNKETLAFESSATQELEPSLSSEKNDDASSTSAEITLDEEVDVAASDSALTLSDANKEPSENLYDSPTSQDDNSQIANLPPSNELPTPDVSPQDSTSEFDSLASNFPSSTSDEISNEPSFASLPLDNSDVLTKEGLSSTEPNIENSSTSNLTPDDSEVLASSSNSTNSLVTSAEFIESEISQTDDTSNELATNNSPESDDLEPGSLSTNDSSVLTSPGDFTDFDFSDEQTASEIPQTDDSSMSFVSTSSDDVSTETAINDLPEFGDLTPDNLSTNDSDAQTSANVSINSEASDELVINKFDAPDDLTSPLVSTESGDLTSNDLSTKTTNTPASTDVSPKEPATNNLYKSDNLTSDSLATNTTSSPASTDVSPKESEINAWVPIDGLTFPIDSTNANVSSTEITSNDSSQSEDLTTPVQSDASGRADFTTNDAHKSDDLTTNIYSNVPDKTEISLDETPKSDDSITNKIEPTVETLPDGLGVAVGKSSITDVSPTTQNGSNSSVSPTPQYDDKQARRSEIQPAAPFALTFDSSLFTLPENETTNFYLERWNTLDKAWQEFLAPLSDEDRFDAIEHYQREMDAVSLLIAKRLAFAADLSSSKRDGFFRLYVLLLSRAGQTAELTALLLEERASRSTNDTRLGYLEFLLFKARIAVVGNSQNAEGLLNLSQELIRAASTSNVKFFLRKTKELADQIGEYDKNLGERTYSVICQEFTNSQDKFRQNMPNVFAGEARFESLPGNELRFGGMSVDNRDVDLINYRGKTTLVVFTNSSCAPYLDELPELREVYAKYNRAGFEIVEYNLDADVDGLRQFVQQQNLPWTIISQRLTAQIDGKDFVNPCVYYGISNLPTAILLDKNGKVISTNARRERLVEELEEIYPDVR